MPTYDYRCDECNYEFELFQGILDEPITDCPKCSGNVRRLISGGAGIIFKGSGFYVTDNKPKGPGVNGNTSGTDTSSGKNQTEASPGNKDSNVKTADKPKSKEKAGA